MSQNLEQLEKANNLAKEIVHLIYEQMVQTNEAKIAEYTKWLKDNPSWPEWYLKQIQIHKERARYAQWLRKNGAFYSKLAHHILYWARRNGKTL